MVHLPQSHAEKTHQSSFASRTTVKKRAKKHLKQASQRKWHRSFDSNIPGAGKRSRYISENQVLEGEIKDLKRKAMPFELERWNWRNRTQSQSRRKEILQSSQVPSTSKKKGASHCDGTLPKRYNPKAYSLQSRTIEYVQTTNTLPNPNQLVLDQGKEA